MAARGHEYLLMMSRYYEVFGRGFTAIYIILFLDELNYRAAQAGRHGHHLAAEAALTGQLASSLAISGGALPFNNTRVISPAYMKLRRLLMTPYTASRFSHIAQR